MTHILVAVNDSGPGRAALLWAEGFLHGAEDPGTAEVLTIWAPTESMGMDGFGLVDDTGYPDEAELLLEELLQEIGHPANFRASVGSGHPVESILVAAHGCDLLVIGTRAAGPVRQALVGSMSQAVVGRAECAVAVIPETYPDPGGRSVVAWDGTPGAIAALGWALEHRAVDKVLIVFVADVGDEDEHAPRICDDIADVFGQEVADLLTIEVRSGIPSEQLSVVDGDVAEIVIGDRARFGPDGSIWGSVTSHVLSTTTLPIVVVPARDIRL